MRKLLLASLVAAGLTGCTSTARQNAAAFTGGDPDRGVIAIAKYGCGSCHTIPGISGAHGLVGPPLAGVASRTYIAGSLRNEPDHVAAWIQYPKSVNPRTVMPALGVKPAEAKDITAYLYSLQ